MKAIKFSDHYTVLGSFVRMVLAGGPSSRKAFVMAKALRRDSPKLSIGDCVRIVRSIQMGRCTFMYSFNSKLVGARIPR